MEKTLNVNCRSLSDALGANGLSDVDFIKLDTQGSELDILRGAEDLLRQHVTGLDVEAEFLELYQGQPLFADIHVFLTGLGFRLANIRPSFYSPSASAPKKTGYVGFVDARYIKPAAEIVSMLKGRDDFQSKLHRTMFGLRLHGHGDLVEPLLSALS